MEVKRIIKINLIILLVLGVFLHPVAGYCFVASDFNQGTYNLPETALSPGDSSDFNLNLDGFNFNSYIVFLEGSLDQMDLYKTVYDKLSNIMKKDISLEQIEKFIDENEGMISSFSGVYESIIEDFKLWQDKLSSFGEIDYPQLKEKEIKSKSAQLQSRIKGLSNLVSDFNSLKEKALNPVSENKNASDVFAQAEDFSKNLSDFFQSDFLNNLDSSQKMQVLKSCKEQINDFKKILIEFPIVRNVNSNFASRKLSSANNPNTKVTVLYAKLTGLENLVENKMDSIGQSIENLEYKVYKGNPNIAFSTVLSELETLISEGENYLPEDEISLLKQINFLFSKTDTSKISQKDLNSFYSYIKKRNTNVEIERNFDLKGLMDDVKTEVLENFLNLLSSGILASELTVVNNPLDKSSSVSDRSLPGPGQTRFTEGYKENNVSGSEGVSAYPKQQEEPVLNRNTRSLPLENLGSPSVSENLSSKTSFKNVSSVDVGNVAERIDFSNQGIVAGTKNYTKAFGNLETENGGNLYREIKKENSSVNMNVMSNAAKLVFAPELVNEEGFIPVFARDAGKNTVGISKNNQETVSVYLEETALTALESRYIFQNEFSFLARALNESFESSGSILAEEFQKKIAEIDPNVLNNLYVKAMEMLGRPALAAALTLSSSVNMDNVPKQQDTVFMKVASAMAGMPQEELFKAIKDLKADNITIDDFAQMLASVKGSYLNKKDIQFLFGLSLSQTQAVLSLENSTSSNNSASKALIETLWKISLKNSQIKNSDGSEIYDEETEETLRNEIERQNSIRSYKFTS